MDINNVIETYKNTVYSIALSHTCNATDADDILQDVFLIYFKKNKVFNDEEHRKAWLIRTTLNRCKKCTSSKWKKRTELNENHAVSDNWQFALEHQNDIFTAMQKLPANYRNVLHLYYFERLTTAQISEVAKIKHTTVRSQLKRAREQMREILKEDYFYE